LTSLNAIFGDTGDKPDGGEPEDDKLLNLYWNRAELKKEFAELRNEKYRLQERLKEQEGATARVEQKLQHLENLLLDPEWVYNIVTFFQLRRLAMSCQSKLAKFAEQLKQQREKRLQERLVDEWNQSRAAEAAAVERQIGEHRLRAQLLEDRLQAERSRLAAMGGITKMFRGRTVAEGLDELGESMAAAQEEERLMLQKLDEIERRQPPDTQGLDTATKRLINFMLISFCQQLYLHFRDDQLAELAKEAAEKSIGAVNYGGKAACDEILTKVRKRLESLEKATEFADVVRQRAKLIGEKARFRSDDDAVPTAASVATIYAIGANGLVKKSEQNLLGENYWNLSAAVSR
jgi:hypothetical protein